MAKVSISDSYQFTGAGPFDSKLNPVNSYSELTFKIPVSQRYEGMLVWVMNEQKYYVYSKDVNDPSKLKWNSFETGGDIIDGGVIE